jgi:hypothetical protein
MAPCLAQHVYLHVACCGSPWHFCFQASPEREAEGVPMIVKLRRGLRASKHEVFKKSKSWYVFSVILQSWQNMCLGKKTRWRKFAHATCPLTMFQASNPKAGLARIEFLKAMLYFWFGSCRDMQRDDGMRRLPESNTRFIRSRNISNHIFVITIFMNIHDIYIVSRSNISAFHDISCAFVVSKTVDGIWPEVRQGAWRPSLQASKLGNFRNSLDEHFETRAAKDFRREQQNVIHFKSRLKVSGFSFHLLSQCFSF